MALIDSLSNLFIRGRQLFTVNYEPSKGTLPEDQGWVRIEPSVMPNQPFVSGAVLFQGPTEYVGSQYWEAEPAQNFVDFTSGNLVWETRVKVIGSSDDPFFVVSWRTGWQVNVIDLNKRGFAMGLSESGVRFSNDLITPVTEFANSIEIPFNTTDDFHTYRLEIANGSGQVFIDGSGAGGMSYGAIASEQTASQMWFGDGTNGASGQTEVLYIHSSIIAPELSPELAQGDMILALNTPGMIEDNLDLYIQAITPLSASGYLITEGKEISNASGTLLIQGAITSSGDMALATSGFIPASPSPSPTGSIEGRFIDDVDITSDFTPSLVGRFTSTSPTSVTIVVWDITDGANVALILLDNIVQQIGDTESWFWSMSNMPLGSRADGNFLFRMTADTGETVEKEANMRTISDGNWKHP